MQSNEKPESSAPQTKWSSKKNTVKSNEQIGIEMKPQLNIDLINSSKTTPNKSSINSNKTTDKKSVNNANNQSNSNQNSSQTNKRSKGPFVAQLHNQIKAHLNLHTSHKSISSLRPTHVFAVGNANEINSNNKINKNGRHSASNSNVCANSQSANHLTPSDGRFRAHDKCCEHSLVHHSFISDITDVRQMENTLLTLLEDFHSGKLQAFGQDITFEKMESVREQQERLARLHFDLNLQQEIYGHQTEEGKRLAKDNMTKLIENLQQLSNSIEQLQSRSSVSNAHS